MLELLVLLVSITAILIFIYRTQLKEPYQNFYLSSCPIGYKSFYDNNGDINCCNGEILGKKCLSNNYCTLNGKGITNCTELLRTIYKNKAAQYCTPSLPNYFEDNAKAVKGCISGELNETMSGPRNYTQAKCLIYDTLEKNTISTDSCSNQKLLDSAQCFGKVCNKQLIQPNPSAPPLVAIQFTDNTGIPRIAYTKASYENFLNISNPDWQNQGIDLLKNINVAEVAKAFYIDKTILQKDIQF